MVEESNKELEDWCDEFSKEFDRFCEEENRRMKVTDATKSAKIISRT